MIGTRRDNCLDIKPVIKLKLTPSNQNKGVFHRMTIFLPATSLKKGKAEAEDQKYEITQMQRQ